MEEPVGDQGEINEDNVNDGCEEIPEENPDEKPEVNLEEDPEENPEEGNECKAISDEDSDAFDEDQLDLYCPACRKDFKSIKS